MYSLTEIVESLANRLNGGSNKDMENTKEIEKLQEDMDTILDILQEQEKEINGIKKKEKSRNLLTAQALEVLDEKTYFINTKIRDHEYDIAKLLGIQKLNVFQKVFRKIKKTHPYE